MTSDVRAAVIARDGFCVAVKLEKGLEPCRNRWGRPPSVMDYELDHVKDQPAMALRAPSDRRHLVLLCHFHHQQGWATSHRPLLRQYLREIEGEAA